MTDSGKGTGGSQHGPPWSVDVLADLHAGVLDPAAANQLWPLVNADPEARAVLMALDSVKIDLGRLSNAQVEPMPAQFAARLDAALQAETRASGRVGTVPSPAEPPAPPVAPVVDLAAARKRRNRMTAWGAGVLTAAAAAAAIAFVALPGNQTDGSPSAEGANPPTNTGTNSEAPGGGAQPPMALSSGNLASAIGKLTDEKDYGRLENEQGLRGCLDALDITAGDTIGVHPVTFDGQDAVAALLGAGADPGQFRIVVVEPTCSADDPGEPLANQVIP